MQPIARTALITSIKQKWVAIGFALIFFPLVATAEIILPDLGEPYDPNITPAQIWNAVRQGMLASAYELTKNLAIQEIRQQLYTEKGIALNLKKLAEFLASKLNDPATTDTQKADLIFTTIDNSIEPYQSTLTGSLNLSLRHTIEYGATRLEWDRKPVYEACKGAAYVWQCKLDFDGNCMRDNYGLIIYEWSLLVWTDYVTREPDYYVYRNVSGIEKLVAKIPGNRIVQRNSFGIGPSIGTDIYNAYTYYKNIQKFPVTSGRTMWYDIHADYHNKGATLAYHVVADDSSTKYGNCGNNHHYETVATADADGDGRMDYIPAEGYAKYFGKYYGWLVPILNTVME